MINLKTFFEEKDLEYKSWEIEYRGQTHFIDNEVVIENILNAPKSEKEKISEVLFKIDFANGDVNDFLKHLANGLIVNRF